MIRHNLFYKLASLVVAVVLCIYVNSERNPQLKKTWRVPVDAVNVATGYVADLSQSEVSITLEGLKSVVESVRAEDVRAWVDLAGMGIGRNVEKKAVKVKTRVSGLPENNVTVSSSPSLIKTTIEALTGKLVPVEVKLSSQPPMGFSYSDPEMSPSQVRVAGKATDVQRVRRAVVSIPARYPDGPLEGSYRAVAVDARGAVVGGVRVSPESVRLNMQFVETPATKSVIVSPNVMGEPKYPHRVSRVSTTPAAVTLRGKPSALIGVSTINTERVGIDGAETSLTEEVGLRVPPGAQVVGGGRVKVTVYINNTD